MKISASFNVSALDVEVPGGIHQLFKATLKVPPFMSLTVTPPVGKPAEQKLDVFLFKLDVNGQARFAALHFGEPDGLLNYGLHVTEDLAAMAEHLQHLGLSAGTLATLNQEMRRGGMPDQFPVPDFSQEAIARDAIAKAARPPSPHASPSAALLRRPSPPSP